MSKLTYEQTRLAFRVIDCLEDLQGYKQFMKEQKELKIGMFVMALYFSYCVFVN